MMMITVCQINKCCGCSACKTICPKNAIEIVDNTNVFDARIDKNLCIRCNLCYKVCPVNNEEKLMEPIDWHQGWAKDDSIRSTSSSGGLARAISESFIDNGGVVCSCKFSNGDFVFEIVNNKEDLYSFQGSKYVKSNPGSSYTQINNIITKGTHVLFIGLPCQAAAVRNYIGERLESGLYTIDLICHGTPSVKILKQFLSEHDINIKELLKISFRSSTGFAVNGDYKIEKNGVMDRYSIGFLNSIFYTENCYECQYARIQRGSDITLGDCWGSELEVEIGKGISLILCQTEKGRQLLVNANVELKAVDLESAIANNPQLQAPCKKPEFLSELYRDIRHGKTIDETVFKYARKKCIKQLIKKKLIDMHLLPLRGGGYMISVSNKNGGQTPCQLD